MTAMLLKSAKFAGPIPRDGDGRRRRDAPTLPSPVNGGGNAKAPTLRPRLNGGMSLEDGWKGETADRRTSERGAAPSEEPPSTWAVHGLRLRLGIFQKCDSNR